MEALNAVSVVDLCASLNERAAQQVAEGALLRARKHAVLQQIKQASANAPGVIPSGPRKRGEGCDDEDQGLLSAAETANGGITMHVTLLAAGFLIGPSGVSIRSVAQKTAAEIRSWSETLAVRGRNRRIRTIVVEGNRRSVVLAVAVLTDAIDLYKELCEGKYCGKVVDRVQIIRGVEFFYSPPPRSAVPFAAALRPEGGGATSPSAAGIKALAKETSAGHARPQKENNGAPQRIQWNIGGATYINAWPGLGSATATQGTGAGGAPVPELPSHKEAHVQTLKSEMPQLPGPEFDLGHDSYALAVENALQAAGHSRPPAHNEDAQIPCLTDPVVPRPYFSGSQHRPFLHAALNEGQLPATSNRSAIFAAAAKVNAVAAEWQRAPGPPQMRQTAPTSAWNQYGDSEQVHRPQQEYAMFPNRFQGWPFGMTPRTAADGPQGEAPMGLTHGVMHPSSAMPQGWLGSPMVPITDDQLRWFGLPTFGDFAEKSAFYHPTANSFLFDGFSAARANQAAPKHTEAPFMMNKTASGNLRSAHEEREYTGRLRGPSRQEVVPPTAPQ